MGNGKKSTAKHPGAPAERDLSALFDVFSLLCGVAPPAVPARRDAARPSAATSRTTRPRKVAA